MDISYLSILSFLTITIVYYGFPFIGKLPITMDILNTGGLENYYTKNLTRLGLYFLIVVITQFGLNTLYLINKCGGSPTKNIVSSLLITVVPWILIFGAMLAVLIIYPGLKTAFSDVVGYFAVAYSANNILSSILVDTKIDQAIDQAIDSNNEQKGAMKQTAEAILKLCGNKSILINKMTPYNFLSVWDILKPLMKNNGNIPDINEKQEQLLKLVVLKDNIGEATWYVYTAVLLTSMITYYLATTPCSKSVEQLKASHEEYLKKEQEKEKAQKINNSTTFVITN
jgi:hypothetical protein